MVWLQNTADGTAIRCESTGGTAVEAVGPVEVTVSAGAAPISVSSTGKCTNLNADLLDGFNSTKLLLRKS